MKKIIYSVSVLASVLMLSMNIMCCKKQIPAKYVASTSWVASIAELAGIDDVQTIAPVNLKHPPEYEITADDMLKVSEAELFMHAGYERMVKVISAAADVPQEKMIKVKTTNTEKNLSNMVKMLSEKAGTEQLAQKRYAQYEKLINETRAKIIELGLDKKTVYANINQAELAEDLGLNITATFGPGPLTADQIELAADNKYDIIIDNIHNPVASPALEVSPSSTLLVWRNFPETKEKNALYNVLKTDFESLFKN